MSAAQTAPPLNIVAVVGLVRDEAGWVLMIDSPRRGWELPGGQVQEGEALPDALVREIREETGIDVEVERLVVVHSNLTPRAKVILGFTCRAIGGERSCSGESRAVEWIALEHVLQRIVHPAVAQRAADLLAGGDAVIYGAYARPTAAAPEDRGMWYSRARRLPRVGRVQSASDTP